MLIRKNTKAFKTILQIITACQQRTDREKLVRLYITKAGHSILDRINIESIEGDAQLLYDMNYEAVLMNLNSSGHQLQVSDDVPGIYFFHSTSNKVWDETPFEFDEAVKKDFSDLAELPVLRKKEKVEKYVFPVAKSRTEPPTKKEKTKPAKVAKTKVIKAVEKESRQPGYKLKHKIYFTNLDKVVFRQAKFTRHDILDYYSKLADYILPYLKDRPYSTHIFSDSTSPATEINGEVLFERHADDIPAWAQPATKDKARKQKLFCNDREHLLLNIELGALQFNAANSKSKSIDFPDYIVIVIDSPQHELTKAIDVANTAREILTGLQLPSFIKTQGISCLQVYIPLDAKSKFETAYDVAEYICKLIRLKVPDLVTLEGTDDEYTYGKVSLNYELNREEKNVTIPYSIVPGESPTVATPLLWDEVNHELRAEDFTPETIFKRLKQVGDPFETLFRKKQNADALRKRLQENYSFLL
jgi:bifunctional non-homologous end joining protein LigD